VEKPGRKRGPPIPVDGGEKKKKGGERHPRRKRTNSVLINEERAGGVKGKNEHTLGPFLLSEGKKPQL